MSFAEQLAMEFSHDCVGTIKTLEPIPADRLAFRPHPKSMTMQALACHLTEIPGYGLITPQTAESELDPTAPGLACTCACATSRFQRSTARAPTSSHRRGPENKRGRSRIVCSAPVAVMPGLVWRSDQAFPAANRFALAASWLPQTCTKRRLENFSVGIDGPGLEQCLSNCAASSSAIWSGIFPSIMWRSII